MTEGPKKISPDKIVEESQALIQRGSLNQASVVLNELLLEYPGHVEGLYCLAVCQRLQEKYLESLKNISRILAEEPDHGRAYQERGYIHRKLGESSEAMAAFEKAVELNPALFGSWRALAEMPSYPKRQQAQQHVAWLSSLPPELVSVTSLIHQRKLYQAEQLCRHFLKDHPHHPEAMRLLAKLGSLFHILDDAEFLLASCLELYPDFKHARLDYVHVLQKRQKFHKALEQAQILLRSDPDNTNFQICLGNAQQATGDFEAAIGTFESVLGITPHDHELILTMGHALKTMGRVDDAIDAYRRSYRVKPGYGDAFWSLANLKTYRFSPQERQHMRDHEANAATGLNDKIHLCFALGKDFEDHGNFEEAFTFYSRGNALKRDTDKFDIEMMDKAHDTQMKLFNAAFFKRHEQTGCPAPDPIFIVGLPRAGSTLLEQILSSHSQVDGTMELSNIVSLAHQLNGRKVVQDNPRYPGILSEMPSGDLTKLGERYMADTRHHRRGAAFFIDKMPNNFRHIPLIHLILPNAKIIDARRHPMACCFSGFKQLFGEGQQFSYSLEDIGHYYRRYVEIMDHWDKELPGRILRVHHEDVVANLELQVRRILDYCGLPFEQACLDFHKTERAVRTPSSEQVRQPIYQSGTDQWQHFKPFLGPLEKALGPALANFR